MEEDALLRDRLIVPDGTQERHDLGEGEPGDVPAVEGVPGERGHPGGGDAVRALAEAGVEAVRRGEEEHRAAGLALRPREVGVQATDVDDRTTRLAGAHRSGVGEGESCNSSASSSYDRIR